MKRLAAGVVLAIGFTWITACVVFVVFVMATSIAKTPVKEFIGAGALAVALIAAMYCGAKAFNWALNTWRSQRR